MASRLHALARACGNAVVRAGLWLGEGGRPSTG